MYRLDPSMTSCVAGNVQRPPPHYGGPPPSYGSQPPHQYPPAPAPQYGAAAPGHLTCRRLLLCLLTLLVVRHNMECLLPIDALHCGDHEVGDTSLLPFVLSIHQLACSELTAHAV